MGNLPMQSLLRNTETLLEQDQGTDTELPAKEEEKPILWLDNEHPWLAVVAGVPGDLALATELYGDAAVPVLHEPSDMVEALLPDPVHLVRVIPERLAPAYIGTFYSRMTRLLDRDVARVEQTLARGANDAEIGALIGLVERWSEQRDLRESSGRSYFDALLSRLRDDQGTPPYLFFKNGPASYLDMLFEQGKFRAGELIAAIAQGSIEHGGYRPTWTAFAPTGERVAAEPKAGVDPELVDRVADRILEALAGLAENPIETKFMVDAFAGLPPPELSAVLKKIMSHYADQGTLGVFRRYGEVSESGMLYRLFELTTEEERPRLAAILKSSGLLKPEAVDSLATGRPFGARYLPYTTSKGAEAAQFWADEAEHRTGLNKADAVAGGLLASLWLPETAGSTVATLSVAKLAPGIAKIHPAVGVTMTALGTGAAAYSGTIALQELATGKDVWTDKPLDEGEKIVRLLELISNVLFVAAGFMEAAKLSRPTSGLTRYEGNLAPPQPGARPPPVWEIVDPEFDPDTGHARALLRHLPSDSIFELRYEPATGKGTLTNVETGEQLVISGGRVQARPAGLLTAGEPAATDVAAMPEDVLAPTGGEPSPAELDFAPIEPETPPRLPPRPEPRALPPGPKLTYDLRKVQNLRGAEKGAAGETYVRETYRGDQGESYESKLGGRDVDVEALLRKTGPSHLEVKAYSRWRTVRGVPVEQKVPLKAEIQRQIDKDTYLKARVPGYDPVWIFLDAPPSAELAEMLAARGIRSITYGRAPSKR